MNTTELEMFVRILKSVWKRKLVVMFCITTYVIVGVIYVTNCTPMYQAQADINLLIMSSKKTFNLEELGEEVVESDQIIATAIKMLKQNPKYQRPNPIRPSSVTDFRRNLSVRTKRRAKNIISLSFQSRSPEFSEDSLTALIKSFKINLNEMFARVISEDSSLTVSEVTRLREARQKIRTAVLASVLKNDGIEAKSPELLAAQADLFTMMNNLDLDPPRFEILETEPPHASLVPISPHKKLYLSFFFLVGAMWGVISATFLEYRDKTFQSPLSISRLLAAPLLQTLEESSELSSASATPAEITRRVSGLRINLELFAANPRGLLITSPQAEAGTTFVTYQLAQAFADAGEKVLVIDASWSNQPDTTNEPQEVSPIGFSDLLCDFNGSAGAITSVIIEKEKYAFHLIPQGSQIEKVFTKLSRDNVYKILSAALQLYDRVLIDAASPDSSLLTTALAQVTEGTLLVVTAESNRKNVVEKVCQNLQASGCHVTGLIANRIPENLNWQAGYVDAHVVDGSQAATAGFLQQPESSSSANTPQNVLPMSAYNKHAA